MAVAQPRKRKRSLEGSSKCICANVRRASRAITKFYDSLLEPSGLKITQYSLLRNIMASGPLSVSELSRIVKLDRTTLVRNLKSLEGAGFIESGSGKDGRMRSLAITQQGRSALDAALPYWEEAQKRMDDYLGSDSLKELICTLMDIEALSEG